MSVMKVLLLVQDEQRIILDYYYDCIAQQFEKTDIRRLNSAEQANLRQYFSNYIETELYDRIILFLRFKKEIRQVRFLRKIPNLVFLEHDAYQNYVSDNKYEGKFFQHYSKLPWVRVLCSGFVVSQKLKAQGIDAVFVPKAYDDRLIYNQRRQRDIETGFIGSLGSKTYSRRKELLDTLQKEENMLVTRTGSGQEYVETLNRIRFFISADVGMGEYMIKNFEAMAAGCVLFAWSQGRDENLALGFKDMHNIVLYNSVKELKTKLRLLRSDAGLCSQIAQRGQQLAEERYTYSKVSVQLKNQVARPLRKPKIGSLGFIHTYSYEESEA